MIGKTLYKRSAIVLLIFATILITTTAAVLLIVSQRPSYIGNEVKLSKPDNETSAQIYGVVLQIPPIPPQGVSDSIQITKFAGDYAQGIVIYSNNAPTQQFMAVKTKSQWIILTHNSGKQLILPNVKTAKQHNLPKGWFKA